MTSTDLTKTRLSLLTDACKDTPFVPYAALVNGRVLFFMCYRSSGKDASGFREYASSLAWISGWKAAKPDAC